MSDTFKIYGTRNYENAKINGPVECKGETDHFFIKMNGHREAKHSSYADWFKSERAAWEELRTRLENEREACTRTAAKRTIEIADILTKLEALAVAEGEPTKNENL